MKKKTAHWKLLCVEYARRDHIRVVTMFGTAIYQQIGPHFAIFGIPVK